MDHKKIIIQETIPFTTQVELFERHTKDGDIIFDIQEYRKPVGSGPSLNICPWCPPQ